MAKKQPLNNPKSTPKPTRKPWRIPAVAVVFVLAWLWGAWWYGDVLRVAREQSFWSADSTLMQFMSNRSWSLLWVAGRLLLQLFRWPVLGGLVLAVLLAKSTYLTAYCLRLRGWWRLLAFVPATVYLGVVAYEGFDIFFEAETGKIMGVPLAYTLTMLVLALIIRSFSRHHMPAFWKPCADETVKQNRVMLVAACLVIGIPMGVTHWLRPYVSVVCKMQRQLMEQDWAGMQQTAKAHPMLTNRPLAAYYAIATVQHGEQGTRLFDILMDYDEPYLHGFDRRDNNATNYYLMDCDFHAGLVQTATHHAMEHLTMYGPTLRSLKMLTKCALMRGEWEVAEKYFTILHRVPFEGKWLAHYEPMLRHTERVDADAELKMVRLVEPVSDTFENQYVQPVFLGYNAQLLEGRSINALWNSLCVQLYTKTMQDFIFRCQPMQGTTPPQTFSEALLMMSSKQPELLQAFPSAEMHRTRLSSYYQEVQPYMKERDKHVRELYPKYKGFYPYYYFFGNLKATKKRKENEGTSNQGVN